MRLKINNIEKVMLIEHDSINIYQTLKRKKIKKIFRQISKNNFEIVKFYPKYEITVFYKNQEIHKLYFNGNVMKYENKTYRVKYNIKQIFDKSFKDTL